MKQKIPGKITVELNKIWEELQELRDTSEKELQRLLAEAGTMYDELLREHGTRIVKDEPGVQVGQIWESRMGRRLRITGFTLVPISKSVHVREGRKKVWQLERTYELAAICNATPVSKYNPQLMNVYTLLYGHDDSWTCYTNEEGEVVEERYTGRSWQLVSDFNLSLWLLEN